MTAQTQVFDDGSSLTTDEYGNPLSTTAATDRIVTANGSAGSPAWTAFWQQAGNNLLSVGTDWARVQAGLAPSPLPVQTAARPAGAVKPAAGQSSLIAVALVGLIAYAVFK